MVIEGNPVPEDPYSLYISNHDLFSMYQSVREPK